MEDTIESQESKPLLRSAKEILEPFIQSEKVHSLDPFEVFERMERAAIYAILEAQREALVVMQELSQKAFDTIKKTFNETV